MSECKFTLNPNANSFIPNKKPVPDIRDIAQKHVAELCVNKKFLTKQEMAKLVGQLIHLRFKARGTDVIKINNYLNSKILHPKSCVFKTSTSKPSFKHFDLSKVQLPKLSFLLVAFWGLFRHEQALRPMLSLTYRPDIVKNKVWSVEASDNQLWNPSSVVKVCDCPPMFGYTIPPCFFGNPFDLKNQCSIEKIHLTHYAESCDGNEFILTNSRPDILIDEPLFEEAKVIPAVEVDIYDLRKKFVDILAEICDLLATDVDGETEDSEFDYTMDCDYEAEDEVDYISLWDDSSAAITYVPFCQQDRNELVDDDDHPLLEMKNVSAEFEVPFEIKDLIRKSLSPTKDQSPAHNTASEDGRKNISVTCDPPCSIWCDSTAKSKENSDAREGSSDSNSTINKPIGKVSWEELQSGRKKVEKVKSLPLKPVSRGIQRSLSVNDCDPEYFDLKFGISDLISPESNSMSSKDVFALLKRDPVNFFKSLERTDSWKDTDSGFVSNWSSQDELCDRLEQFEKDTIWSHVSAEDSLWTPLPECVEPEISSEMLLPHKRVRDLRRQRSVS